MGTEISINNEMLVWAIDRAGFNLPDFFDKMPKLEKWLSGEKKPTAKQLESFSKKVHLPFGYLFLPEPPIENLPIPFFRTNSGESEKMDVNVYDTIIILQQRQDWLKNYLNENHFDDLEFVGSYKDSTDVKDIVNNIRNKLNLPENWASSFRTWEEALNHLIEQIEESGIITAFNGVVDNNTHRKISVDKCRGFVLVDKKAPFMFVNNGDSKSAQMFTIVHELAHVWTGESAGFDFRQLQPANNPNEILCDKVAAEFLVPEKTFNKVWKKTQSIEKTALYFKVSPIVIGRRALDIGKISRTDFFEFYKDYISRDFSKKKSQKPGGNFYATTRKRLGVSFANHINNAVKSNQLLYRDAYKLTSMKGDTFNKFFSEQLR
ncbi:MAG: ImmA/IrrE family metallo-endopeptidase [Melioribacteraceae bacterium]|jgi:Zn-dependent peptidase ImmA (M78 family)|nr:ImmA/IrrE family metallo-endopeptidase [Melioribacteraceae bacterium]